MKFRALHRLLALLVFALFSLPAIAQVSSDAEAKSAIDEAINNYYLMMQLDQAEQLLMNTASECGGCSGEVKARAWMYVGIVRGSGKTDQAGAAEAFATAKGFDPAVELDADLASEETKATFASATGSAPPPSTGEPVSEEPLPEAPVLATTPSAPGALPPPAGVPGEMLCSPQGAPIGLNMPIPISCSSEANIAEGFVKFKEPGATEWKKISLVDMSGLWQAEIPCKYTSQGGSLEFYVGVKDNAGEYVDQFGSKKHPGTIEISPGGLAPAYPGQEPVVACAADGMTAASDCPPDFPGCGGSSAQCGDLDWGAACKNSSQCKCGLLCEGGTCQTAPTCTSDMECDTGACVDGYCSALKSEDGGSAGFPRHFLGLSLGMDFMSLSGSQLCTADQNGGESYEVDYGIRCYRDDERVNYDGPDINGGFAPAQMRIKIGYDFAITKNIQVGAQVGLAFLNTRPKAEGEVPFLLIHGAARGTYNIFSVAKKGFRPALFVEFGLQEMNGKVVDKTEDGDPELYKVAGFFYAGGGARAGYFFTPNAGLNLDLTAMVLFPGAAAFALHPAINFQYGF